LICFGPKEGKEQTFVLLEEWVPNAPSKSREDSLSELAKRYFRSHGPATVQDFAGWTGLTLRDARAGLESVQGRLISELRDQLEYWWADGGTDGYATQASGIHLLPGFDEYILGYKDRRDVMTVEHATRIVPGGNGVFLSMIVVDGQVVGKWKRTVKKKGVQVVLEPFLEIDSLEERVHESIMRYCTFADLPLLSSEVLQ
jgi:Winged helix DNA-binding domain